jgi:hypothetical protein
MRQIFRYPVIRVAAFRLRHRIAVMALIACSASGVSTSRTERRQSQNTGTAVRFHHAHYAVGDPSAAMSEAARAVEGVRVILQGLGVGVRAGREFLLFDRAADRPAVSARRSATEAYPLAVERLRAWGFTAEPPLVSHSRVAAAMRDLPVEHLAFTAGDFEAAVRRCLDARRPVLARRDDSVLFDAGTGLLIEIVRDTDREETFWCPMHPDVRSADAGKCPICAMTLVPIPPPKIGEYNLDVEQVRDTARRTTGLTLTIREPDTDALVTKFASLHERLLHLFIVSRDLRYFAHVHPGGRADGSFTLAHPLAAGEYMLIADFVPLGGTPQMVQKAIIVTEGTSAPTASEDASNGLKVAMKVDEALAAGREAKLTFTVRDGRTGALVTDLQPYLGAPAHMLLVRTDLSDAVHAHPEEQVSAGPEVSFHPIMPSIGSYKLWIQFQRAGQVSTAAFELQVAR